MSLRNTRRQFLMRSGALAAGLSATRYLSASGTTKPEEVKPSARVVIARDDALGRGQVSEHRALLGKLLAAAMQKLGKVPDAATAWRQLFTPRDRVGIKVNTLGLATSPAVVEAIVAGLRQAGVPAENIIIWDRFDSELAKAGFKLNKSGGGVQCRGTDAERYGSGYLDEIEVSGQIGSCFSRIVAREVDRLISVPVLKDHNLAGLSGGLKNFYGAIHNPNKYHENNCDPYIVDVIAHRYIGAKWKLTVYDATRGQYHAGPQRHESYLWPFGGLLVSSDVVAADAVAADLLDRQRRIKGMKSLAEDQRPAKHLATAAARGLGTADLSKIERLEV